MSDLSVPREYHLPVHAPQQTAVDFLAAASGLSRRRIKQAMQKGAVWLSQGRHTRRLRRATRPLPAGSTLHLYYDAGILASEPPAARLLQDAGEFSVWFKPAGMYSQGSKWGDHCAIDRWVARELKPERPAFTVHRLDRAASGLILIAHQKRSAAALAALFASRAIDKRYRVGVHGEFPADAAGIHFTTALDSRPARSHALRLAYDAARQQSLLEVRLATGRKHQIRRHLAGAGFPVVGDPLYGNVHQDNSVSAAENPGLQLLAWQLAFTSPFDGRQCRFRLPTTLLPDWSRPGRNTLD